MKCMQSILGGVNKYMAKKRIAIDEEVYAHVSGYAAKKEAETSEKYSLARAAEELIMQGVRTSAASIWEVPFAYALRASMREVAEADRIERLGELADASIEFESICLEIKALLFAVMYANGLSDESIAGFIARGIDAVLET